MNAATNGNGGVDTFNNSIYKHTIATNNWSAMPSIIYTRGIPSLAADKKGHIYAIGGRENDGVYMSVTERFNPTTNKSKTIANMNSTRFSSQTTVNAHNRIYVAGGFNNSTINYTERYNPSTNK